MNDRTTLVSRKIRAPRQTVYQAFLDPVAVAAWLPPEGMTGQVHAFDPRAGGEFRMSLIYQDPAHSPGGKSSEDTDTFQGKFAELVPDELVVWVVEFDSPDPAFAGEMRIAFRLTDTNGGTNVVVLSENIPSGIRPEDNEAGCRSTLENLAAYLERQRRA